MKNIQKKGFTLIELLIVIGIIAVLAGVVLVALNPARQFAQANNTTRTSHVNQILGAIGQRTVDIRGDNFEAAGPTGTEPDACDAAGNGTDGDEDLPAVATNMSDDTVGGDYNIADCLVDTYLPSLPVDPQTGDWTDATDYDTQYEVVLDAGRVTVSAPDTELCTADPCPAGEVISATR